MKVLFAVSSESISEAIIKRYQKEYKEILSYKNVYYFNAILKEIQKDKTYDRIVISEDLEPFSNNNYDTIDKFIFEKLDSISDEAQDSQGKDTSIILICTDRRVKGSAILVKLFGIGVYNALLGNDRSMDEVCKLINRPRSKKEAKIYYRIDSEDVNYKAENENEVSEVEIQNILAHFKKIGRNTAKYSDSFNNIAAQYTDEQLRIIVNCLPINVKAVLESECERYQELMAVTGKIPSVKGMVNSNIEGVAKNEISQKTIGQAGTFTRPIVIPSAVRNARNPVSPKMRTPETSAQKTVIKSQTAKPETAVKPEVPNKPEVSAKPVQPAQSAQPAQTMHTAQPVQHEQTIEAVRPQVRRPMRQVQTAQPPVQKAPVVENEIIDEDMLPGLEDIENEVVSTPEPIATQNSSVEDLDLGILPGFEDEAVEEVEQDNTLPGIEEEEIEEVENTEQKRGRGRPRKTPVGGMVLKPKGKRGRPKKLVEAQEELQDVTLPGLEETEDIVSDVQLPGLDDLDAPTMPDVEEYNEAEDNSEMLPGLDDIEAPAVEESEDDLLAGFEPEAADLDMGMEEQELPEEDYTDEVSLPGLDDLDDLDSAEPEEYEEISEDVLPGFDNADEEVASDSVQEYAETFDDVQDYEELPEEIVEEDALAEEDYTDEVSLPGLDELDDDLESPVAEESEDDIGLDDLLSDYDEEDSVEDSDGLLPGLGNTDNYEEEEQEETLLPGMGFEDEDEEPIAPQKPMFRGADNSSLESIKPKVDYSMSSLNSLITKDKKIVTFIGTSKNGNSFLVNNLAALFSSLGINTAILDMTKNKNSYFIFTKNEEELRTVAYNSIEKLQNGYAEGVRVDKNLTVYTDVPASGKDYSNAEPILSTLVQNHSLILIDCDYDTDASYFASCQEMYLVQSMDILTIQPLTAFLRELKTKGILEPEKIRVVINKEMKIHKKVGDKDIIGGLAYYNDPAMSFMTELFNKDTVKAISIPFDPNAYARYLGGIVDCEVSLNGYSKQFLSKLKLLGDMVYPLTSKQSYSNNKVGTDYNPNAFSSSMNDTLSKMRKKY